MKPVPLLFMFLTLSGCGTNFAEIGQAPFMSPVGQGLQTDARAIPVERRGRFTPGYQSVWDERRDLYRDPRAGGSGIL